MEHDFKAAKDFIDYKFAQNTMCTEEYYHIFKYHGKTIRAALELAIALQPRPDGLDEISNMRVAVTKALGLDWPNGVCPDDVVIIETLNQVIENFHQVTTIPNDDLSTLPKVKTDD